jgi:hypothetical protein
MILSYRLARAWISRLPPHAIGSGAFSNGSTYFHSFEGDNPEELLQAIAVHLCRHSFALTSLDISTRPKGLYFFLFGFVEISHENHGIRL